MPPRSNHSAVIEVSDVFKIFHCQGARPAKDRVETVALRGVSLKIEAGEFLAIEGPSGSGKSTLLNLMGGLDTPSAGAIRINGSDIGTMPERERALIRQKQIGFVFQDNNLIPFLTALENVALPLRLAGALSPRQRALELLERLHLGGRLQHRPSQLSGGEAQRTGIACALANHPSVVLADELTGELDSTTGAQLMELMRTIHREEGTTLVIVTHNQAVASFASRRIHLKDGLVQSEEGGDHA